LRCDDARVRDAAIVGEVEHASSHLDRREARRLAVDDLLADFAVVAAGVRDGIAGPIVAATRGEQDKRKRAKLIPHEEHSAACAWHGRNEFTTR
jgi:hypothetical protein